MCSDTLVNQQTGWKQQRASSSVAASKAVSSMLRRRSALCADHLFTTALTPLSHQWMATRPVVISYLALPGRHPSQKFVQHPSRRHARVLPETIGTAVTLNVVKCLERASPHLRTILCLPQHRRLGMPAIDYHE